jgi:hypothetical protein
MTATLLPKATSASRCSHRMQQAFMVQKKKSPTCNPLLNPYPKTSHGFQIFYRADILRSLCVLSPTYPKWHLQRYSSTLCTVIHYPICIFHPKHPKCHPHYLIYLAESGGRAGLGRRSAAARLLGYGFESHRCGGREQRRLSLVTAVCCQMEVAASD